MQELFTRAEVAKMIHNMLRLEKMGKGFDAWSETVYDDNGGWIMDSLLDMGEIPVPEHAIHDSPAPQMTRTWSDLLKEGSNE